MRGDTVAIGIHSATEWQAVLSTLDALRAHTIAAQTVVFAARLDDSELDGVRSAGVPVLRDADQVADAALCLQLLAASLEAGVYVLLEAGSIPGPGWFEALLHALKADRRHALAGPSTNFAWNEQCTFPGEDGGTADVARTARAARVRFAGRWRTLRHGYSLSDFCLAVRREVVDAIRPADEVRRAHLGWDANYSLYGDRCDFVSVWACSSYVWRSPSIARRRREEARVTFDAFDRTAGGAARPWIGDHRLHVRSSAPLVSCVMVTGNRRDFALQSVRYFERQDYAERELIILDDGADGLSAELPANDRIRYVRVPAGRSIGVKRNRGCELARGSIIAQWDDDDWYSPSRLSTQVVPLIAGEADITGLKEQVFFDLPRWRFWSCSPALHRRIFVEDVCGGSLVYLRRCWEKLARYPDCSLAEDAAFLRHAVLRGARLKRISEPAMLVYVRHGCNTWQFECGSFVDPDEWAEVAEPTALEPDRLFYVSRAGVHRSVATADPLVSCIMPTADRRRFVPQAISYFLRQTYPKRELLIVDDGTDPIGDLVPASDQIRYIRLASKHSVGAKRNLACELAGGELIAHWDDDDWSADWRLAYQVQALRLHGGPAVCGLAHLFFVDLERKSAWMYHHAADHRAWVAGGTLVYHKSLWRQYPFPDSSVGEDSSFVDGLPQRAIVALENNRFYVATVHSGNTSRKLTSSPEWQRRPAEDVRALLGEEWSTYAGAACELFSESQARDLPQDRRSCRPLIRPPLA